MPTLVVYEVPKKIFVDQVLNPNHESMQRYFDRQYQKLINEVSYGKQMNEQPPF